MFLLPHLWWNKVVCVSVMSWRLAGKLFYSVKLIHTPITNSPAWHRDAEGLIFYHCFFFLYFFFRRLISEVTERISTKLGHILTCDCYLKNLVRSPPGIYPPPTIWGKKTLFGTYLELWPNISLQRNMISTTGKKLFNLPYMLPNLVNFDPKTAENGWRVFAYPQNFRNERHCQPYCTDDI